jgi:hypothetical protein
LERVLNAEVYENSAEGRSSKITDEIAQEAEIPQV